jgi:hypothetical protein
MNIVKLMHNQKLTEVIFPPTENTVGICKQITSLFFYQLCPRLVIFVKSIYASLQVSNVSVLNVCFKLIKLSLRKSHFLSWKFYYLHVLQLPYYGHLAWILEPLQFRLLPFI